MPKTPGRSQRPEPRSAKAGKALRRAIARTNPVKEPPTVGKPVIIDPAEPEPALKSKGRHGRTKKDAQP